MIGCYFFFSSRRRHTRWPRDWSSDVCSSDLEGEEEAGSPTFRPFIETFRERLSAALIIVADSANWAVGVPSLTTSLRRSEERRVGKERRQGRAPARAGKAEECAVTKMWSTQ